MSAAPREPRSVGRTARVLLALFAVATLSVLLAWHAGDGWRWIHDDNGVRYTSYARTHLRLGLRTTRGIPAFYDTRDGSLIPYTHHPPALELLLAGWFRLTGRDDPFVARLLPIACHAVSAVLLVGLLLELFPPASAAVAAVTFALVPMSSYFGKLVNFEPIALPFVIVVVSRYWRWAEGRAGGSLRTAFVAAAVGTLVDWPVLFGLVVVAADAARRWWRGEGDRFRTAAVTATGVGLATFALVAAFLATSPGGLGELVEGAARRSVAIRFTWGDWVRKVVMTNKKFFTRPLQQASVVALAWALWTARRPDDDGAAARLVLAFGAVGLLNVVCFPNGAFFHFYWQFYLLPFAIVGLGALLAAVERRAGPRIAAVLGLAFLAYCGVESVRQLRGLYAAPSPYVASRLARWRSYL